MRITLYRNNPHSPNGMMSQETFDCDHYRMLTDEMDSYAPTVDNGRLLILNRADFAAILVDTTDAPPERR